VVATKGYEACALGAQCGGSTLDLVDGLKNVERIGGNVTRIRDLL